MWFVVVYCVGFAVVLACTLAEFKMRGYGPDWRELLLYTLCCLFWPGTLVMLAYEFYKGFFNDDQ